MQRANEISEMPQVCSVLTLNLGATLNLASNNVLGRECGVVGGRKEEKVNSDKGWEGVHLKNCGHSEINVVGVCVEKEGWGEEGGME